MTARGPGRRERPFDGSRKPLIWGGAAAALFFAGLLGSAAAIPMDSAAHAEGVLSVAGKRQAVQTRDGGIIAAILAKEGEVVRAGQILVRIAATEAEASERSLASEYIMLVAQRSRLDAERGGLSIITLPPELSSLGEDDLALVGEAMKLQQRQLDARRRSIAAQRDMLQQRIRQLADQSSGTERRLAANRRQQALIAEELEGIRSLAAKGFAPRTRVLALERNMAALDGEFGAFQAEIARIGEAMGETRLQIASLSIERDEDIAQSLRDTQGRIDEIVPRLAASREQMARMALRAPVSGRVVGTSVFTIGGVASPGQTLMEIVPVNRRLVVEGRLEPDDADDIGFGQAAQLRLTGLHERNLPVLTGRVTRLSADRLVDERTGKSYFGIEVTIDEMQLARLHGVRGTAAGIQAGLPVEILVPLKPRTALSYLLEPLLASFRKSGREH